MDWLIELIDFLMVIVLRNEKKEKRNFTRVRKNIVINDKKKEKRKNNLEDNLKLSTLQIICFFGIMYTKHK